MQAKISISMASSPSYTFKDRHLLSFQVVFSSRTYRRNSRKPDNLKVKSWCKGIMDLDFDARKCVIRDGEKTPLMQLFTAFQKIGSSEDATDHLITLTFATDEWEIIPQNIAEMACIQHISQYMGNGQLATVADAVRIGLNKGIIGLEHLRILKYGLVQQYDNIGRKLQLRFLVLVPGKLFGFQGQHEIAGYPASFVTSLFNGRVTTLPEVAGFQLHVDASDPLYLDPVEEIERPSWIKELHASIECTKDSIEGILITPRPTSRTSKIQWRDINQVDAQQRAVTGTEVEEPYKISKLRDQLSIGGEADHPAQLASTQEPMPDHSVSANTTSNNVAADTKRPAFEGFHSTEQSTQEATAVLVGSKVAESSSRARFNFGKQPALSRARICLEDSLFELETLVGHIQASNMLSELRQFNVSFNYSSNTVPKEKKKYPSPTSWFSSERRGCRLRPGYYDNPERSLDIHLWPDQQSPLIYRRNDQMLLKTIYASSCKDIIEASRAGKKGGAILPSHDDQLNLRNSREGLPIMTDLPPPRDHRQASKQDPIIIAAEKRPVQETAFIPTLNSSYVTESNPSAGTHVDDQQYIESVLQPKSNQSATMRKSTVKPMRNSNVSNISGYDEQHYKPVHDNSSKGGLQSTQLESYSGTLNNDNGGSEQSSATNSTVMPNQLTSRNSTVKSTLSRQVSRANSRSVAFSPQPDIMDLSDYSTVQSQQPAQAVDMKNRASNVSAVDGREEYQNLPGGASRQSGILKSYDGYEQRSAEYSTRPSSLEQFQEMTSTRRQSRSSTRKSSQKIQEYAPSRKFLLESAESSEPTRLDTDTTEEDFEPETSTHALLSDNFDIVVTPAQRGSDHNEEIDDQNSSQGSQSTSESESHDMEPVLSDNNASAGPNVMARKSLFKGHDESAPAARTSTSSETRKSTQNYHVDTIITGPSDQAVNYIGRRQTQPTNQAPEATFQPADMRKSQLANRQSSMQRPAPNFAGTTAQPASRSSKVNVQPNSIYTEERKSMYKGSINDPIRQLQSQGMYGLAQAVHEDDPSEMSSASAESSGSQQYVHSSTSRTGSTSALEDQAHHDMPDLVLHRLSETNSTNESRSNKQGFDIIMTRPDGDEVPAEIGVQLGRRPADPMLAAESRKSRFNSGDETAAAPPSNYQRSSSGGRPSNFRPLMRAPGSLKSRITTQLSGNEISSGSADHQMLPKPPSRRQSQ